MPIQTDSREFAQCDFMVHFQVPERVQTRGAESESEPESESPGVVATSQESESETESIKLPRLRLRNVLFENVI